MKPLRVATPLSFIVLLLGCFQPMLPGPRIAPSACRADALPLVVQAAIEHRDPSLPFNKLRSRQSLEDLRAPKLEHGNHPDLEVVAREWVRSKRYGWKVRIPYGPCQTLWEDDAHILLEASHTFGDGYSLATHWGTFYYLLDKKSGEVLKRVDQIWQKGGIYGDHFEDNILYLLSQPEGIGGAVSVTCVAMN